MTWVVYDGCGMAPMGTRLCATAGVTALIIKVAATAPATHSAGSDGFRNCALLSRLIAPSKDIDFCCGALVTPLMYA
jgi:hypothetical protein